MPRLSEADRQAVMSDFNGHYEEVLIVQPNFEIESGYGLPQLRAREGVYDAEVAAILAIEATGMPVKRAQRDALFGTSPDDPDGVWAWLKLYKQTAQILGRKNRAVKSIASVAPNLGRVSPGTYDSILGLFIANWTLINEALAAQDPPAPPLLLGPIDLAELESRRAQIAALESQIDETVLTRLTVMRAQREETFGDVIEDKREADSIIARLEAYANKVQREFLGQPVANALPRIFPEGSESLPRFAFNWKQVGAQVTLWWQMPENLAAAVIFLKEGAFEETRAIPPAPFKVVFDVVAIQGDLDEVELRDATGKTLAHGRFDAALVEPV